MTGLRRTRPAPTSTSSLAVGAVDIDLHEHGVLPVGIVATPGSGLANSQLPVERKSGPIVAAHLQKRSAYVRGACLGQQHLDELAADGTSPPLRMNRDVLDLDRTSMKPAARVADDFSLNPRQYDFRKRDAQLASKHLSRPWMGKGPLLDRHYLVEVAPAHHGELERRRFRVGLVDGSLDYQRIRADAHVKPAPNAARQTREPGFTRPCSSASYSASGIEVAVVLP